MTQSIQEMVDKVHTAIDNDEQFIYFDVLNTDLDTVYDKLVDTLELTCDVGISNKRSHIMIVWRDMDMGICVILRGEQHDTTT